MISDATLERVRPVAAAPAAAPDSPPSSRLDKSTLLDRMFEDHPAERRIRIRYFPKAKIVQGSWGIYKAEKPKRIGERVLTPEEKEHNKKRATMRARANIRRDLLIIGADRMLTLTYRDNVTDRKKVISDFRKFTRVLRRIFKNFNFVAVLEAQERGALHIHMGIAGWHDVNILRAEWLAIIGPSIGDDGKQVSGGNIDISFKPDGKGNPYGKMASYMAKYLGEDVDVGRKEGEHRYFRSQNIERPSEVFYVSADAPHGAEADFVVRTVADLLAEGGNRVEYWSGPVQSTGGGYMVGSKIFTKKQTEELWRN